MAVLPDPRFMPHNLHLEEPAEFAAWDPQLRAVGRLPLVHRSALLAHLPCAQPGIYSLTGGRQVGKTTVLKQWMADLLRDGTPPGDILYLAGELIDDHQTLVRLLGEWLAAPAARVRYVLLDAVTCIRAWDRGVKFLADTGALEAVVLLLTGSDTVLLRDLRIQLPGRRGAAGAHDFHLYPLTLWETAALKGVVDASPAEADKLPPATVDALFAEFDQYLGHGGYLRAINDLAADATIAPATCAVYADWIRGDVLKRGKRESTLREVLAALVARLGSQVTWNGLARELSVEHPATVQDYVELLARMDAVLIQPALREDKLAAAPKKARKVGFLDPFVLHAVRSWLTPTPDPYAAQVRPTLADPEWAGRLAELCAVGHYARFRPTYYLKAEGEVDIAYVADGRCWPLEVKWTGQLHAKSLKQITKYPHGRILTRRREAGEIAGVRTEPLPVALWRLGPSPWVRGEEAGA